MITEEKNFGYLGSSFQQSLIKTIIEDRKYGELIIDVLESKYFDNNSFKFIMDNIKEYFNKYDKIPDYASLTQKIISENQNSVSTKVHLDSLEIIKENTQLADIVKDKALNFCKQQNLKKELKVIQNIIENGEFESYNKIEKIIQKAMQVGLSGEEAEDVFHDMESALEKDSRHPIPTGVVGLDNLLKGGIGRGEVGVLLAPTGVGKTTLLTKFSNAAYSHGFNVLQVFFEDNQTAIKQKHFTIWTGIPSESQHEHKEEILEKVRDIQEKCKGSIRLLKLPSDTATISEIKTKIRKMISDGFKIDLLVLDYVDCISPEKSAYGEEWKSEGTVMRSLDSMANEFNIGVWTATQGNRDSISSEVVTTDQMGGSIKKAQFSHIVISVGKTMEQKEHNLATISILKSRISKDGIIFNNCKFDNEYLIIDTESQTTLLGHEEQKQQEKASRVRELYLKRQEAAANKNK